MGSGLTRRGEGPSFPYAGNPLRVLAGAEGTGPWAAAEIAIPARFAGPIPHVHDTFDEAFYIVEGSLTVAIGNGEMVEAPAGSFFTALRGTRHAFANPSDQPARLLGLWSPPDTGLEFMRAVGEALPAAGPPDPDIMRALYERHHSHLQP